MEHCWLCTKRHSNLHSVKVSFRKWCWSPFPQPLGFLYATRNVNHVRGPSWVYHVGSFFVISNMARTRRNSPEPASTKSEPEESTPPQGGSPTTTTRPSQAHVGAVVAIPNTVLSNSGDPLSPGDNWLHVGCWRGIVDSGIYNWLSIVSLEGLGSRVNTVLLRTQVESQILKTGYTVEAEDAAASKAYFHLPCS